MNNNTINLTSTYTTMPTSSDLSLTSSTTTEGIRITGKIIHNGLDLDERLKSIEDMLQIPHRDAIMEEKYKELAQLGHQYRELLEKLCMWETLKS